MFDASAIIDAGMQAAGQPVRFVQGAIDIPALIVQRGAQRVAETMVDESQVVLGLERRWFVLRKDLVNAGTPFEIGAAGRFEQIANGKRLTWTVLPDPARLKDQDDDATGTLLRIPTRLDKIETL